MGKGINRLAVSLLRVPLAIVGLVLSLLSPLISIQDRRLARKHEEELVSAVRNSFQFLFSEYNARFVPRNSTNRPLPFDYATVTVHTSQLLLRFSRGREEFVLQLAPLYSPESLYELSTVLFALEMPSVRRGSASTIGKAAELLRTHIDMLSDIYSSERFSTLRETLRDICRRDQSLAARMSKELNRRLYG